MDYRQAKRIRERSLADVIAANLVAGESTVGAFRKGISQKTRAKFTAIKEKFDPLNIVKAMTGGSKLAPALLGRMLGRSQRDIEYFAGTARPLYAPNKTASRIGKVSGGDGQSNLDILTKIYTFMQKTQENEMRRYELMKNYREENQLEDEKRHKELLKALGGIKSTTTTQKDSGGGLLDTIRSMVKRMIDSALKAFEWVKDLKWLTSTKSWVRSLLGAKSLVHGIALMPTAVLSVLASPWLANAEEMEKIQQNPNDPKYKNNPYAMLIRGEATSLKQAGEMNVRTARRQIPRTTVQEYVDSDLPDETLKQEVGADRNTLKKWLQDNPNPAAMFQGSVATQPKKMTPQKPESDVKKPETSQPAPPAPPAAATPTTGQRLATATTQNQNLNLPAKQEETTTKTVNVLNKKSQQPPPLNKLDRLSVRNPEETFQHLIFKNTVVV